MEKENKAKKEHPAERLAEFIEFWLGNPVARRFLGFCTADCKRCGSRIENALKEYTGENRELCASCRTASFLVKNTLEALVKKTGIKREDVILSLKDPMWRKGLRSVLKGIAKNGIKKPFTGAAPFLTVWNITKACNLNCKHCYEESGHVKAKDELTTEEALIAVDKLADAGIAYIAISGGEPLMRPDLWEIIDRIREKEMAFSVATNATIMTKEIAKRLKEKGCLYVQISLDGAKPETHNTFRGVDAFERTIEGIKNCVAEGIITGIAMTVTHHNLKEVPEVVDLAEKLGANIFMHYNFIPTGRGREIVDLDITPEEREGLLKYLADQMGQRKLTILSTAPQFARVCIEKEKIAMTHFDIFGQLKDVGKDAEFLANFIGGCGTSRLYCAMEPNGDILPCVFLQIKLGNIRTSDFTKLWENEGVLKDIRARDRFKGNCADCENRCVCGGCRARAYGYYRDVTQSDPGCIKNKEAWEDLKKGSRVKITVKNL